MDGFKNSTKTQYSSGGACKGYAKGGAVKGAAKISKVMGEFKSGTLHSGSKSGPEVTSKKQATAIALSEARKAGAKIPMKKGGGGSVEADDVLMARMTPAELAAGRAGVAAAQARLAKKTPSKAVPVASKRPLVGSAEADDVRMARLPRGSAATQPPKPSVPSYTPNSRTGLSKGGQPVQKKSLGGVLKAMSPVAALASGQPEKLLGGMTTMGLIGQLLKKKQSGQTLTPAENQQVAQASSGSVAAKKGGMIKNGGLAAMPKKK